MRPYLYAAFGHGVESDLLLPELSDARCEPTIRIARASLDSVSRREESEWTQTDESGVYLGWRGVGTFKIENHQITVDPDPEAPPGRVRLFLLGAAMGVLLHRNGLLVLHGSAIRLDGGAVVFLGPKGGGKSTTAAALLERGGQLISDDVVAIDFSTATPVVRPAFAQLKLWPDALQAIGRDEAAVPRIHPDFEKRDLRVEGQFAADPVPLRAVFMLKKADDLSIEAMDSVSSLQATISHWYCARFPYETLARLGLSSHFLGSTDLVRMVDFFRLERPGSLAGISAVAEAVEGVVRDLRPPMGDTDV